MYSRTTAESMGLELIEPGSAAPGSLANMLEMRGVQVLKKLKVEKYMDQKIRSIRRPQLRDTLLVLSILSMLGLLYSVFNGVAGPAYGAWNWMFVLPLLVFVPSYLFYASQSRHDWIALDPEDEADVPSALLKRIERTSPIPDIRIQVMKIGRDPIIQVTRGRAGRREIEYIGVYGEKKGEKFFV